MADGELKITFTNVPDPRELRELLKKDLLSDALDKFEDGSLLFHWDYREENENEISLSLAFIGDWETAQQLASRYVSAAFGLGKDEYRVDVRVQWWN